MKSCLDDNWVSSAGPQITAFEQAVAGCVGASYGIATVNGTSALHLALLVAGVQPGDEVLVPALTFIAPVNAVTYCGAYPVFMDCQLATCNLDPQKTSDFIERECEVRSGVTLNRCTGRRIAAIVPVHLFGHPADLDPIRQIASRCHIPVVEDASESLGARYKGCDVGAQSDIAVFSFNGNKVITTGGGGMIVTSRPEWAERARYLSTQAREHSAEYVHDEVGYNYRMPSLNAALGLAQMEQLDTFIERKRAIAHRYMEAFEGIPGLRFLAEMPWAFSTYWLSTVCFEPDVYGPHQEETALELLKRGIEARRPWQPIHWQKPYRDCQAYRIEAAIRIYETALSLPCSAGLTEKDQGSVIEAVLDLAGNRRRSAKAAVSVKHAEKLEK